MTRLRAGCRRVYLKNIMLRVARTGLFDLMFSNVIVQLSALVTIFILADILPPSEVGFFRLLFGYFLLFQTVGLLGCNASILKFCSEDVDIKVKRARLFYFRRRSFLASLFSVFAFNAFLFFLVDPVSKEASIYMHVYTLAIPFAVYSMCSMAFLQSLKKVKMAARVQGIIRLSFATVAIFGGIFGGLSYVIYVISFSYVLASIALFFLLRESESDLSSTLPRVHNTRKLSLHSFGMLAAGALAILQQNIDLYLLGFYSASYQLIADFGLASILFTAGVLITGTIQTVLTPYLSEKQDDLRWVRTKAIRLQILVIPFSFFFGVCLYLGLSFFIHIGFFSEYLNVLKFSVPMIIKYWIWSLFCVFGAALFAIGVIKETLVYGVLIIFLNLLISLLAAYNYGVEYIIYSQPIVAFAQLLVVMYIFNNKTMIKN